MSLFSYFERVDKPSEIVRTLNNEPSLLTEREVEEVTLILANDEMNNEPSLLIKREMEEVEEVTLILANDEMNNEPSLLIKRESKGKWKR